MSAHDYNQAEEASARYGNQTGRMPMQDIRSINKSVQLALRKAVDHLGWSDSEVAQKAGLPQSTVYRVLNAKTANPSYGLVHKLCQTLGIPLPFNKETSQLIAPVKYFIGVSSLAIIRQGRKTEHIHILPELQNFVVGKVVDDCANRKYPKGSILFIEDFKERASAFKPKDIALVRISGRNASFCLMPMMLLESPIHDEWVLHHLTENVDQQFMVNLPKGSLIAEKNGQKFEVIGRVHKALI